MTEDLRLCEHVVEGNPDGPTLVFIHGWPDNASLWRRQVEALGGKFRCVLLTLPNFGEKPVKAGGFDFPALLDMISATIRKVQPVGRVGLVTHDWGAYIGYMIEKNHPEQVERMAAFDIGAHIQPRGIKEPLMIIGYQWALVAGWLIGGLIPPLGNWLCRRVASVVRVPARQRRNLKSRYSYPYFYLWRNTLLPWMRNRTLGRYRPNCPFLYLYGKRKPLMFHSPRWLQIVEEHGGRNVGIEGAGHWLMETHPDPVNDELIRWFSHSEN